MKNSHKSKDLLLFDIDETLIEKINVFELLTRLIYKGKKFKIKEDKKITSELNNLLKKYRIGIWSQGVKQIQLFKLKNAGIMNIFDQDQIWISIDKVGLLSKIQNQGNNIYIVDDKDYPSLEKMYANIYFINKNDFSPSALTRKK